MMFIMAYFINLYSVLFYFSCIHRLLCTYFRDMQIPISTVMLMIYNCISKLTLPVTLPQIQNYENALKKSMTGFSQISSSPSSFNFDLNDHTINSSNSVTNMGVTLSNYFNIVSFIFSKLRNCYLFRIRKSSVSIISFL